MTNQKHSVVLGAGLMGRLLAHSLARLGHRVDVYEAQGPDAQGAAARVAAAMLAPLAESAITELPVVQMGQLALKRWPELLKELQQAVFFQQNGAKAIGSKPERCWCMDAVFTPAVIDQIPDEAKSKACVCAKCAGALA